MRKIASLSTVLIVTLYSVLLTNSAQAGLLGETVKESQSAYFESQATLVLSSRAMNIAEEVVIVAPTSAADATTKIASLDDKADLAKDKAATAYDKATEYLNLAQDSKTAAERNKFVSAADTYEKTAYFYSLTADLYLTAQQKTAALALKLPDTKSAKESAGNVEVRSFEDAKLALAESVAEVVVQKKANEIALDASKASLKVGTPAGVSQVSETVTELGNSVAANLEIIKDLVSDYQAKAAASPAGSTRDMYNSVVKQYKSASSIASKVAVSINSAKTKFANAIPENPVNPGDNLKWHIFQENPQTALAVMKYNFAQLAFSAIHWEGMAQSIAQDTDYFLNPANHQESITEYINGFRSSAMQVSLEAKDLRALVSKYNDLIATANDNDAKTWTQVSSYLTDIVTIYDEMAQSQYQIYTTLSKAQGTPTVETTFIEQNTEAKSVLTSGELVVAPAGELSASSSKGKTSIVVYTTAPSSNVSISLAKTKAKTVTSVAATDTEGVVRINLPKDYVGYTVSVSLNGKLVDKEKVTKP
jgi:hypothetical protein